ncbi:ankyrin repeat domain-containing protein [Tropicibacter sp. R16_0]|uniref:ankyrin repeat domain-containing protein n=1 Tax=Tropicibacter sp. R16_0 TaxID=2821102 RepID=UPI001ADAD990|nr:ankyrin repeat domain-containing protein [Tropicibacter sp. R16_0]MBO9448740.1 ankyrin repeat domain-containing protein [Tropicibacter sp. R16_0]
MNTPINRPSLDHLRRQAKTLKKSFAKGEADAKARVAQILPQTQALTHSAALHVIAREAGHDSWPKLKFHIEALQMDRAAKAEQLKQALFQGGHWRVEHLLAETPDLADDHFGLLCALYRVDAVREWLERDKEVVGRRLQGPRRPILHLAFSRHIQAQPELEGDMLTTAELLLAAGADVNDGYPSEPGSTHMLSALYGAIGHANNRALGQWLLDHGADPNDNESLYHATELGHLDGLRMLLAAGADPKGTNALLRALDFNARDMVALLLENGADADEFDATPVGGEEPWVMPSLHQAARRMVDGDIVRLLLDHGADPNRVYGGCTAYGFARVFGNVALARAIEETGNAPVLTKAEQLLASAAEGEVPLGAHLHTDDLPREYKTLIRSILHLPGRLDHVKRLVALGLDPEEPDREGLTALHVAGWEGLPEMMEYLLSLEPDLGYLNGYGGNITTTILHGAEHCLARDKRDHAGCLQMVLDLGLPLGRNVFEFTQNEAVMQVMQTWVDAHPDRLVDRIP